MSSVVINKNAISICDFQGVEIAFLYGSIWLRFLLMNRDKPEEGRMQNVPG